MVAKVVLVAVCAVAPSFGIALRAQEQATPKTDVKDAGSATKAAVKKTGSATKKETKTVVNKTATKTDEGAKKVEDKTKSN